MSEIKVQSVLLQKLSKVTYEHIVDSFHKFNFMLDEMAEHLHCKIYKFQYQQIISGERVAVKSVESNVKEREGGKSFTLA